MNPIDLSFITVGSKKNIATSTSKSIDFTLDSALSRIKKMRDQLSTSKQPLAREVARLMTQQTQGMSHDTVMNVMKAGYKLIAGAATIEGVSQGVGRLATNSPVPVPMTDYLANEAAHTYHKEVILQFLRTSELPRAVITANTLTAITASELADRSDWSFMYLTLCFNESGCDPFAAYPPGTQGEAITAWGSMGWLRSTWTAHCTNLPGSAVDQLLQKSLLWQSFATIWRIDVGNLKQPFNYFGDPSSLDVFQFSPSIMQLNYLAVYLAKFFTFDRAVGWRPIAKDKLKHSRWVALTSGFSGWLSDYSLGRMIIVSAMHINGPAFLHESFEGKPLAHSGRQEQDLDLFMAIYLDSSLELVLAELANLTSLATGDPVSPVGAAGSRLGKVTGGFLANTKPPSALIPLPQQLPYGVSSPFGYRKDPTGSERQLHNGVDILAPDKSELLAPADGTVVLSGNTDKGGQSVKINHGLFDGVEVFTGYAHLSKRSVVQGAKVRKGEVIGYVGNTGSHTTGPHLHLTYQEGKDKKDPLMQSNIDLTKIFSNG